MGVGPNAVRFDALADFDWIDERDAVAQGVGRPFEVVFVCTGNRFRSALAEGVFRAAAGDAGIAVQSYGTLRLDPVPALPEAVELARAYGVDLSAHRCRSLVGEDLRDADLVVGFELVHAATAVLDAAAARDRTFLLAELVAYLDQISAAADGTAEGARRVVEAAAALRRERRNLAVEEIDDPLGRPAKAQALIADDVAALTSRLAARLFGAEERTG
jgi:protein-tyrosine phosphatase